MNISYQNLNCRRQIYYVWELGTHKSTYCLWTVFHGWLHQGKCLPQGWMVSCLMSSFNRVNSDKTNNSELSLRASEYQTYWEGIFNLMNSVWRIRTLLTHHKVKSQAQHTPDRTKRVRCILFLLELLLYCSFYEVWLVAVHIFLSAMHPFGTGKFWLAKTVQRC